MPRTGSSGVRATRRGQARLGVILVAPVLAMTAVFFLFPLGSAVYFSLTDWNGADPRAPFVGLRNFVTMAGDAEVLHALGNNAIWIVVGTAAPLLIGLLLAVILWSGVRAVLAYRLVFFLPFVLPGVAVAIVWGWIYDPVNGWLNRVLEGVGLGGWTRAGSANPGPLSTRCSRRRSGPRSGSSS